MAIINDRMLEHAKMLTEVVDLLQNVSFTGCIVSNGEE